MRFYLLKRRAVASLILLIAFGTGLALAASTQTTFEPLSEGLLVQSAGDPKVYYIQSGQKRWIISEQAFLAQLFRWSDITQIDSRRLAAYTEGPNISTTPFLGLGADGFPDLVSIAPYDLRFAVENGQTRLRFTASFWNRGNTALEVRADDTGVPGDGNMPAIQRIFGPDGAFTERFVGQIFWHSIHNHYHYADFGDYTLQMVRPISAPVQTQKTTFCLRDDQTVSGQVAGVRQARAYTGCRGHTQGVSVGWADVYASSLPDQFVNMTGLPAGVYKLMFNVDPQQHFAESNRNNNQSVTFVQADPTKRTLNVIASASPFPTSNNRFPDGFLLKAEGDPRVYVIQRNSKRWIPNEQVFNSYGFSWAAVYEVPQGILDVIPNTALVRLKDNGAIYVLNDAGYKRRILNPDVMSAYGWSLASVTAINSVDFNSIPSSDLIMQTGSERVYSINRRAFVGNRNELSAAEQRLIHVINETDFRAYAVSIAASNLNVPWDIVFLPDGDILVTERAGTVRRIGKQSATITIPAVQSIGEGGLMGIALHPNFASNNLVYLYYTSSDGGTHNQITRFRLDGNQLIEERRILDGIPAAIFHDGGQIAFGPDGMLYVTIGDANIPESAQNLTSLAGKTLRLTPDGDIPSDNPLGSAIWSYGHRNAQGIAWDSAGRMWQTEHGRSGALSGFDELNQVNAGKNYGWPTIQGNETQSGMEAPAIHSGSDTTWAPSGMAFVNNRLFFAGLRGATLYEAVFGSDGRVTGVRSHFSGTYGRLRAVVLGPDGALYVSTSNRDGRGAPRSGDDKIIRIYPDFLP